MNELEESKAKQFAVEQSERIKQDHENFMFPNRNAPSQAHLNIWRGMLESEIKKQKSKKDVFNNLQQITSDTASIYNQVVGASINWGKIEKRKYPLGHEYYDLEEILQIDPKKISYYISNGYFHKEYYVELGNYDALKVSSLEYAKESADRIKREVETIQNSINRSELNPYFKELYSKDIPFFQALMQVSTKRKEN